MREVYLYDEKNNKFTVALHEQEIFKTEDIVDIKEDKSSNIWVGTTKSLIKVDRNTKEIIAINVDVLNRFEDGAEVTAESLLASGAISKIADGVKILGNGELTKKLNVKVNAVSETAKSKIEAAGGTVEVI